MDVYVVERSDGLPGGHETLDSIHATEASAQKYLEELGPFRGDCYITRWPVLEHAESARPPSPPPPEREVELG